MKILKKARFWILLIILLAAVLRFYRLPEYMQFLGDEGRDALIVKRMIVDHKFTLLGPTMSVAGFYVGPIYYYFMIPFLWLFQLNPVGPAVMAALFGVGAVWCIYYFCKQYINEKVGLIAALLFALSPKAIYMSQFSWNPNPIPFFVLLTMIWLHHLITKQKPVLALLIGLCLGILTQLHYTTLVFAGIVGISLLFTTPKEKWIKNYLLIFSGFVVSNIPLLLFEVRHNFVNIKGVFEFATRDSAVAKQFDYWWAFRDVFRRLYEAVFGTSGFWIDLIRYLSLIWLGVWSVINVKRKEKLPVIILLIWFFVGILGIGAYRGQLEEHYFAYLFPLPFIILATFGDFLTKLKFKALFFVPFIAGIVAIEIINLPLWHPPANIVEQTKVIDRQILTIANNQPYNFALISKGNSDQAYRYFLEVWGKTPVVIESPYTDPQRKTVTNQLIVVCEGPCGPLGHPLWEVAGFGRAEIESIQQAPAGIKIYKLIHYK